MPPPLAVAGELDHLVVVLDECVPVAHREVREVRSLQPLVEVHLVRHRERAGGLVEDGELGPAEEDAHRRQALLLAHGEDAAPVADAIEALLEAVGQVLEADAAEEGAELGVGGAPRHRPRGSGGGLALALGARVVLVGVGKLHAQVAQGHVRLLRQEEALRVRRPHDLPLASLPEAGHDAQEAALAHTRGADEEHAHRATAVATATSRHVEVADDDAVHSRRVCSETFDLQPGLLRVHDLDVMGLVRALQQDKQGTQTIHCCGQVCNLVHVGDDKGQGSHRRHEGAASLSDGAKVQIPLEVG
mmetsp:Transcript_5652/g.17409  ORF Transcript_5652/g.17409 Transcript_5652/m.17409 type:complete len:303 (+) Transcript_5652:261-1169(+)